MDRFPDTEGGLAMIGGAGHIEGAASGFEGGRGRRCGRGTRGETITEVLVSTLIAGLALLMLATAIASVAGILNAGDASLGDYYRASAYFAEPPAEGSGDVEVGSGEVAARDAAGKDVSWSAAGASGPTTVEYVYDGDTGAISYEGAGR